jgi:hypothetical protein
MRKPNPNYGKRKFYTLLRKLIAEGEIPQRAGRRARALIREAKARKERGPKPIVPRKPKKRGYAVAANRKPITPVLINRATGETSEGWVGILEFCNHYKLSNTELTRLRLGKRKSPLNGWEVLQPVA